METIGKLLELATEMVTLATAGITLRMALSARKERSRRRGNDDGSNASS